MSTEFYNRNWRMPKSSNSNKVSNYSMSFDGTEYITITDGILLNSSGYTLSMWFNATSFSRVVCLVFDNSSNIKFISIDSATSIRIRDGVNQRSFTVPTMSVSNWYNIIITVDNGSCKVYLNSTESTSGAQTVNQNWTINGINGYSNVHSGDHNFTGKIDHVAIFDYALSASQVTSLYGNSTDGVGNPMAISGGRKPIAYYPIGDYAAFNGSEYLVPNGALSDYVFHFDDAPSNNSIDLGVQSSIENSTSFTLNFWLNPSSFTSPHTLLGTKTGFSGDSAKGIAFDVRSTFLIIYLGDDFSSYARVNNPLSLNEWTLLSVVYDGSGASNADKFKIYYGSTQQTVNTFGGDIPSTSPTTGRSLILGEQDTGKCIETDVSNLTIFSSALQGSDITTLYNNGSPLENMPSGTLTNDLTAWYKLDASATFDGSNWSIPDDSSNSNTGTSNGMTAANLVQSDLLITQPYSRYALNFDSASSDYIDFATASTWTSGQTYTISMWMSKDSDGNIGGAALTWANGTVLNNIILWFQNATTLTYNNGTHTNTIKKATISLNNNEWYHFCFTGTLPSASPSSSDGKFYLNGVEQALSTSSGISANQTTSAIGRLPNNAGFEYEGLMSNLALFESILTPTQVTELYNQGKPSNLNNHSAYSNLVNWWQLGENSSFDGTNWTVLDEKGTNNGTSANMGEDAIVNGVGTSGNGLSSGMGGADNIIGDAPYSTANAVSYGMGVDAKSTSVPS